MKTNGLKRIAIALSALMLMQSCTVYQKNLTSIDEALMTEKRKKLVTADNKTFYIKGFEKDGNNVLLTAPTNSNLTKYMSEYVTEIYSYKNQARLEIPMETIKGFYLKDIKRSRILTYVLVFIPVFTVGILFIDFSQNCCGPGY